MEVYGSRWTSQSSKLLRGGLRRCGWVRLPYASATEIMGHPGYQQASPARIYVLPLSRKYNIWYNIHEKQPKTRADKAGFFVVTPEVDSRGCCKFGVFRCCTGAREPLPPGFARDIDRRSRFAPD
jgi:hypothetical protein